MNDGISREQLLISLEEKSREGRWDLSDVLPARKGKLFQVEVIERLESMLLEFERKRQDLSESTSIDSFEKMMQEYEGIAKLRSKLNAYAYMLFSEDTKLEDARTFKSATEELIADATNRTLFFELWWKAVNPAKTEEFIRGLPSYAYFLKRWLQTRPHTLSEPVEQAINLKDVTGRATLLQLYHQVRNSFLYEVTVGNKTSKLTEEQLRDLFHSSEKEQRNAAYFSMLQKFERNSDVLGEIYKALVRDWRNEGIKLRKYPSPISIRNISNDVSDEAVNSLLESCKENANLFRRFFRMKSRILGIEKYSRVDIYAPVPNAKENVFAWNEGMKLVLSAFASFDEEFASLAKNVPSQLHIDHKVREGKLGGAYCMSVTPEITPYILMSYTGKPKSVSTLAHELGHAVHDQISAKRNNQLTFEPPLPLAETASVFAELLLTDRLLRESDLETRKSLLMKMVDESYATILRQSFFVLFEKDAHSEIPNGVNVDDLSEMYLRNLKEQFSDSVVVPSEFRYEWLSIPHIFQTPFYCYSYSWGNLLVLSLYRQFREEGPRSFAPRFMKILSFGGADNPERILSEAGFDVRSKQFWQSGFDELKRAIDELELLV